MSGNSWEIDSYRQGKWEISVRRNMENDRVDEGDFPEGQFYLQKIPQVSHEEAPRYNIYKDNQLIAEVRGWSDENRTIIPMRELNELDEESFYRFLDENLS